jgi:hypothetical protein
MQQQIFNSLNDYLNQAKSPVDLIFSLYILMSVIRCIIRDGLRVLGFASGDSSNQATQ